MIHRTTTLALLLGLALAVNSALAAPSDEVISAADAKEFSRALELATSLAKNDPPPPALAGALFKAASAGVDANDLQASADFYQLFLATFPESEKAPDARAELLGCYYNLRQLDKSIAQSKKNLATDPDSKWVEYWHFVIAQCEFRLWKFDESKPKLEAFMKNYPDGQYAKYAQRCLDKIDPDWEIDANGLVQYSGKYEGDIRLKGALKTLPEDIENGHKMLEERLGIDLRPHTKVIFFLQDAGPKAKPGLKASTYVVGLKNEPAVAMRFYTEYVVTQPENYRQTITHEMKHAGFKGLMGQAYEDLPTWIKEGLAVWGADDVETRLQLVLSNQFAGGKDPLSVLDGIADAARDEADYMEDVLAFEWLESKGAGKVKAFCRQLVAGKPYQKIWSELSGMEYDQAITAAEAHCRTRVEGALGDAHQEIVQLRAAHEKSLNTGEEACKKWLAGGGEQGLKDWIKKYPEHPAEPFARFCLARSYARASRGDEGREIFKGILANDSLRCTILDDAQFWIGVSHNWAGEHAEAAEAFGILLRDFPASHSTKQVRGKFKPAGPVTR